MHLQTQKSAQTSCKKNLQKQCWCETAMRPMHSTLGSELRICNNSSRVP